MIRYRSANGSEIAFAVSKPQINQSHDYVALVRPANSGLMCLVQIYYIDPYAEVGDERLAVL